MFTRKESKISDQIKAKVSNDSKLKRSRGLHGNIEKMVSTGSTLLDLAISGGRVKGGGIPGGIFVEVFGPESSGKTVLLAEIAGGVHRLGGDVMFKDPEARLDKKFAEIFDLHIDNIDYSVPDTVTEVFEPVRKWEPIGSGINGIFADSLAALSTELEMGSEDKMGTRRAKEFSEQLRKTCRIIKKKNYLMIASNQIRENVGAVAFEKKWVTPGGKGIPFYASLRLHMRSTSKMWKEINIHGKEVKRVIGIKTDVEVYKSSIWHPNRVAPLTIDFAYGIDDIRQNLQYVKDFTKNTTYMVRDMKMGQSLEKAIDVVEDKNLERKLCNQVIEVWTGIEKKFEKKRKKKVR